MFGFSLHQQGGTLAAGASPGYMLIDGDYTLDAGAILEVELAGSNGDASIDFDRYDITGDAVLNGMLEILGYAGFDPAYGEYFDVLSAVSIDAAGLTLSGLDTFTYEILPDGDYELLRLIAVPEPGSLAILAFGGIGMLVRRRADRPTDPVPS